MTHELLEMLIEALETSSKSHLEKYGSFYPCAAVVNEAGGVEIVGVQTGSKHPDPKKLIEEISKIFSEEARLGKIQASGVSIDVKITLPDGSKSDAIQFDLEQRDGKSISVFLPYLNNKAIEYGEMFTHNKERRWFKE